SYGEPARNVSQLAVEDINAAGGVLGKKLEIDYQDHACNPQTMTSVFGAMSARGEKVVMSVACSGTVLAVAPTLEQQKMVLVATNVTTPKITGVSPYLFRNWAVDLNES